MRFSGYFCAAALVAVMAGAACASDQQDQARAERIAVALRDSGQLRDYSVGVKYARGTVWLYGRVASQQQMQSAMNVVGDLPGVQKIVNDMTVGVTQSAEMAAPAPQGYAQRVSATNQANAWGEQAAMPPQQASLRQHQASPVPAMNVPAGGEVVPAGFHRLAAKKAARHACPPSMYAGGPVGGNPPAYDQPHMPNYAWPSYASYPNYSALTYPQQYSPTAWPYIGPFYPYPQVPLGWRKVALEWDDGWWFLDFYDRSHH